MEIITDKIRRAESDISKELSPFFILDNYYGKEVTPKPSRIYSISDRLVKLTQEHTSAMVLTHDWLSNDVGIIKHSLDVAVASILMGIWKGMGEEELWKLSISALLHDIGKIYLNPLILDSPYRLHSTEMNVIKQHPLLGYLFIHDYFPEMPYEISQDILFHHEKVDGTGYFNITGHSIPLTTRIITIADIFSACVENRSYHESRTIQDGLDIISEEKGLDTEIVRMFRDNFDNIRSNIETLIPGEGETVA